MNQTENISKQYLFVVEFIMSVQINAFNLSIDNVLSKDDVLAINIFKSIKSIIRSEGYISYNINIYLPPCNGENMLATILEVNLSGETTIGYKEINLFIKILPNDTFSPVSIKDVYEKELFFYKDLYQVFTELQDEYELSEDERFNCIKVFDESSPDVIIMDNMAKKGFITTNRMETTTLEYAKIGVQTLAKFHALSFVLEAKRPEYFDKEIKTLRQPFNFDQEFSVLLENIPQITINRLSGESKIKLENFVPKILQKYAKYLKDNNNTKCCLCHGDFKNNNILIKKTDGVITKMIPIDYQLIHYGCPVLDFLYFLIPGTDHEFRKSHLSNLKDLYYETLGTFLNHFHLDVDSIYPRREFEKVYRERLDYGLIVSLILVPILMAKEDDVPTLVGKPLSQFKVNADDKFSNRIVSIVNDYIEWGYL